VGYYAYYTVYQALYPDSLPDHEFGRAWAYQSIFQGIAVGLALVGGGALFDAYHDIAFVAVAGFFVLIAGLTLVTVRVMGKSRGGSRSPIEAYAGLFRALKRDAVLRNNLAAHFFWEYTLAAIRAFVLLYLLRGLGLDLDQLLPLLGAVVAIYLVASLASGEITDRGNMRRYTTGVIIVYAIVMLVAGLTTSPFWLGITFPFGMFAGAAIMMLAYPILLKATDKDHRVAYTAYYQANRGLALLLGTSLTGLTIDTFGHYFPASNGYQVMWLVTGVAALLSLPFYRRLPHQESA
jgi:MFS family permease